MIKRLFAVCFVLVLGFVVYLAHPLYLPYLGRFLIASDVLEKADAIVVLGGDDVAGHRVSEAVSLMREGWAEVLLVSGGPIARGVTATGVMRKQAEELGIPPARIIALPFGTPSSGLLDSTFSEARSLLSECRERRYKSVIVVTSNYHTRRARRIFKHIFNESRIQVIVHPSEDDSFKVDRWWTRRADARTWFLEIQKLAFSYLEQSLGL